MSRCSAAQAVDRLSHPRWSDPGVSSGRIAPAFDVPDRVVACEDYKSDPSTRGVRAVTGAELPIERERLLSIRERQFQAEKSFASTRECIRSGTLHFLLSASFSRLHWHFPRDGLSGLSSVADGDVPGLDAEHGAPRESWPRRDHQQCRPTDTRPGHHQQRRRTDTRNRRSRVKPRCWCSNE